MKNIALPILAFLVTVVFSYGQIPDQNPNYQTSLDIYTKKLLDSGNTTMSTTVQDTYKAIDEWQDKKDRKIENDRLSRQYRQERRLARINRPNYYSNRYAYAPNVYGNFPNRNYNQGFGYGNGYGNNFGYGYGQYNGYGYGNTYGYGNRNGYGSNAAYCLPYSYPGNFRLGASVRLGRNVWLGF
ncbi:hypothetical protein [uncultured Cytophaga sp.]|uniref:hypothetical protein n=1 Tax=uncultured Cytophaga sp. TaxID=160238 RepID=UPI002633554D|nr:hypothetical protein [uncultured Cytophaga sp.]